MTKEQIINAAQFFTVTDIKDMFDVSQATAYRLMREIKAVSNILGLAGKVTVGDYEAWLNKMTALHK